MAAVDSAPPRVELFVIANGEIFGGAERQIITLLGQQPWPGATTLLSLCDGPLIQAARQAGLNARALSITSLISLKGLRLMRQVVRSAPRRIVHVHGYRATVFCALALIGLRFEALKTEHGAPESRGETLAQRSRHLLTQVLDAIATAILRAHVIFVTQELRRLLGWRFPFCMSSVIYNGVDMTELKFRQGCVDFNQAPPFTVVAVGRLEHVKGFDVALQSLKHLDDDDFRFIFVGSGPLESDLNRMALALDLRDRATFVGHVADPFTYIGNAQALIVPSRHEGLPYVVLEALALGTPVVASNVGGLREVLIDGVTAILVPPEAPDRIADALKRLASSATLQRALPANGRDLVERRFSAGAMSRAYAVLYSRHEELLR